MKLILVTILNSYKKVRITKKLRFTIRGLLYTALIKKLEIYICFYTPFFSLSFSDAELSFQVMQYFLKIASLPVVVVLMRLCHQRQNKNTNKSSLKYIFYQTPPHTSHTPTISSQKQTTTISSSSFWCGPGWLYKTISLSARVV